MSVQEIKEGLKPLFEQAEKEDLIFYCGYQDLFFTPQELKTAHSNGRFIWGVVNWDLRPKNEPIERLESKITMLEEELEKLKIRFN